jgi:hypothetical protein
MRYQAREVKVIVLDPLNDPDWPADFQTTDPEEFLKVFWASQSCAVFIDEAGQSVGRYNEVMQRTATRGRHWGHAVHFVTQRGVQLPVTVRDQCGHLFLFTTARKDSKIHADEWNRDELEDGYLLAQGNYYHVTRFGTCDRGSLFGKPWSDHEHRNSEDSGNGERPGRGEEDARPSPQDEQTDTHTDRGGDRRASSQGRRPGGTNVHGRDWAGVKDGRGIAEHHISTDDGRTRPARDPDEIA